MPAAAVRASAVRASAVRAPAVRVPAIRVPAVPVAAARPTRTEPRFWQRTWFSDVLVLLAVLVFVVGGMVVGLVMLKDSIAAI